MMRLGQPSFLGFCGVSSRQPALPDRKSMLTSVRGGSGCGDAAGAARRWRQRAADAVPALRGVGIGTAMIGGSTEQRRCWGGNGGGARPGSASARLP
jgi:hypothetical protein